MSEEAETYDVGGDGQITKTPPPLRVCPCGEVPENLVVEIQSNGKYGYVFGTCCGQWLIEFRNGMSKEPETTAKRAQAAWTAGPRGVPIDQVVDVLIPEGTKLLTD